MKAMLVLVFWLCCLFVFGQPLPSFPPGASAVASKLVFDAGETLAMAGLTNGGTIRKSISWGTRVPYAGGLLIGGAAIYGVLDWFYKQAQNAASGNADLDNWYRNNLQIAMRTTYVSNYASASCNAYGGRQYAIQIAASSSPGVFPGGIQQVTSCSAALPAGEEMAHYRATLVAPGYPYGNVALTGWQKHPSEVYYVRYFAKSSLSELLQNNAGARAASTNILNSYYQNQTPIRGLSPMPYTAFEGESPNKNQWADDPTVDKSVDTDGDGWSDYQESIGTPPTNPVDPNEYPATDPVDPGIDPNSPGGDLDGDGWTNGQEEGMGTDPENPLDKPEPQENCPSGSVMSGGTCVPMAEIPEDIATETTLQRVAVQQETQTEVQRDILDKLREESQEGNLDDLQELQLDD